MSEGSESDDRSSGRRWITLIATLVLITLGVGYATFAALYIANRTLTSPDAVLNAGRAPGTVTVTFIPQAIDPERENIRGVLKVTVDPPSTPQGVTVRLYPFLDVSEVVVPADTATVELDATLATEGEVRSYPFDDYTALVSISAFAGTDATTPVPVQGGVLPIDGLTGWNINASADLDPAPDVIKESVDVRRSLTTSVTTMILAGLVAALGLLALFLAWSVTVGRKRILFSEATWLAATIFSVISVRNFMPGAPPIGAYIDTLIVIPVILALFFSMAVLVVMWLARRDADTDDAETGTEVEDNDDDAERDDT